MGVLADIRSVFGEDVTPSNLMDRLRTLKDRMDAVLYGSGREHYPQAYVSKCTMFRLHLAYFEHDLLPGWYDQIFDPARPEEITVAEMAGYKNQVDNFFLAKETPFGVPQSEKVDSICVEINLEAPEKAVLEEVSKILAREQGCRWKNYKQPEDAKGRPKYLPIDAALRALEEYEAAMEQNNGVVSRGIVDDDEARTARRRVDRFFDYLAWDNA